MVDVSSKFATPPLPVSGGGVRTYPPLPVSGGGGVVGLPPLPVSRGVGLPPHYLSVGGYIACGVVPEDVFSSVLCALDRQTHRAEDARKAGSLWRIAGSFLTSFSHKDTHIHTHIFA